MKQLMLSIALGLASTVSLAASINFNDFALVDKSASDEVYIGVGPATIPETFNGITVMSYMIIHTTGRDGIPKGYINAGMYVVQCDIQVANIIPIGYGYRSSKNSTTFTKFSKNRIQQNIKELKLVPIITNSVGSTLANIGCEFVAHKHNQIPTKQPGIVT